MNPLTQRETHRNMWQAKTEGNVVVNALQLNLCRGAAQTQTYIVFQSALHRTDAPCPGSEINEHKGVSRVSGKPGGKRTKFVLMVKAGRPAGVGSMNRVHLSRRACACVGSNVQAGTWQHENERLYPPKNLASSVDWSSNFFGLLRRNLARFCIFHFKAGNSWRCAKGMRLHSGSSLTSPSRNSL